MSNSLAAMRPELVREWSDKNLPLMPDMINEKSRKNVWWKCREYGNEWKSIVYARIKGTVSPVCEQEYRSLFNQGISVDVYRLIE